MAAVVEINSMQSLREYVLAIIVVIVVVANLKNSTEIGLALFRGFLAGNSNTTVDSSVAGIVFCRHCSKTSVQISYSRMARPLFFTGRYGFYGRLY